MILQALNSYYLRKMKDPDPARRLPVFGLEHKEIPFIVELTRAGHVAGIKDTRSGEAKKRISTRYLVPKGIKKTSGIAANLLWDNAEYVLGLPDPKKLAEARAKGKEDEYLLRLHDMKSAFRARIEALPASTQQDEGIRAVLAFLNEPPAEADAVQRVWGEIAETNPVLSFRLAGDLDLVCQRSNIAEAAVEGSDDSDEDEGDPGPAKMSPVTCLVTGATAPPMRLHAAIKGVRHAHTAGANIVSFNRDAFISFGKAQGANAPVSQAAAFAYTTALNHLLEKNSRQRMQVGDASTVFWAQEQEDADTEGWFADFFGEADDPDAHTEKVRSLYEAIHTGRFGGNRGEHQFFVLGLAPSEARLAVRFWHVASIAEISRCMCDWFEDLCIARGPNDPEYPSLFRLLTATAIQGKADNVPPKLGGDLMRSVLTGAPFPATWLSAAIQRCRSERRVSYLRAATIKACLNRSIRRSNRNASTPESEMKEMLDPSNSSAGYRLGRLFAVLEKIQEEANPGLNATIRERYYGAASSTPIAVFTTLLRLKNHHLAKLSSRGRAVNFERLLGDILGNVKDFPKQLPLQDQGRFALGYYHQRHALFTRSDSELPAPTQTTSEGN